MTSAVPALLSVGACIAAGALVGVAVSRWSRRRRGKLAQRRGRRGERDARAVLEQRGYAILQEQVEGRYVYYVDDRAVTANVRADVLVGRGGKKYIVEVKTGAAADLSRPALRRQLLEYHHAFPDAAGVLYADMKARELCRVDFPATRRRALRAWVGLVLAVAALSALAYHLISTHSPFGGG